MKVDLSKFFDELQVYTNYTGVVKESKINLSNLDIEIIGPVEYDIEIYLVENSEPEIKIDISYIYQEPCNRCLNPTKNKIKTQLSGKLVEGRESNYLKQKSEDENYIFYENNKLDIIHYIESQISLSLPMKTLCKSQCKGLCSNCGVDLNKSECDCIEHTIDPRLAKLKDIFPNN